MANRLSFSQFRLVSLSASLIFLSACPGSEIGTDEVSHDGSEIAEDTTPLPGSAQEAWTLIPGRGAVGIGPEVSHQSLREQLGRGFVIEERLANEAGSMVRGTVLFPGDSTRRLEIVWRDTVGLAYPILLRAPYDSTRWRVQGGAAAGVQTAGAGVMVRVVSDIKIPEIPKDTGNSMTVEDSTATGNPMTVEDSTATGNPLTVKDSTTTGNPMTVEDSTNTGNPTNTRTPGV